MMPLIAPPRFLIDEIVLVDVLALFLSIATAFILWYVLKKIFPDQVKDIQFFLTFIIVIVPFVILVYFGGAVINYNAIAIRLDRPEVLPLNDRRASSLVSSLAAVRRPGSAFIINIAQRLTVSVPHDETIRRYFDGPRRREAAGCDSAVGLHSKAAGFALTPQTTATSSGPSNRSSVRNAFVPGPTRQSYTRAWRLKYKLG